MSKEDLIELHGEVIDILKGDNFKVKTSEGNIAICKPSGKIRQFKIKIIVGDKVRIEVSPYDLVRGRIVYRDKG